MAGGSMLPPLTVPVSAASPDPSSGNVRADVYAIQIGRVRNNVRKIIEGGGTEAEIDSYLASEGLTAADLRSNKAPGSSLPPITAPQPSSRWPVW